MSDKPNSALREAQAAEAAGRPVTDGGVQFNHPAVGVNQVIDAERGAVALLMPDGVTPRKKMALVGFAGATRAMAPFDDPEWAICGMNQLYRHIPRCDLHYEIHREWNTAVVPGTDHAAWLRDCGIPVMMTDDAAVRALPTAVRFPIERILARFDHDYLTSTVAFMLAYTIDLIDQAVEARLRDTPPNGHATALDVVALARTLYAEYSIGIYGIDLIVGREYAFEKPCAEFFLGIAHARGIKYHLPENSALLWQSHTYGYDAEPDYGFFGLQKLKSRTQELQKLVTMCRDKVHVMQGHVEEAELVRDKMPVDSGSRKVMDQRIIDLRTELDKELNILYMNDGAQQEASRMYAILELKTRGGGVKA